MTRDRVVIDTNVFISGLLADTSTPGRAIEHAIRDAHMVTSRAALRELTRKLLAPTFDRYVSRARREALLLRLAPLVEIVEIVQEMRVCRDPHDDAILEAAVNGRADLLVTGDRDLLALHPFRGIAILTPAAYLSRRSPTSR